MTLLIKNRFNDARGKEVPLDYFLYSCFEAELLYRHATKNSQSPVDDIESSASKDQSASTRQSEWTQVVQDLLKKHCDAEPLLATTETIDFEKVGPISAQFVAFALELASTYKFATGTTLPVLTTESELPMIWQAIYQSIEKVTPSAAHLFQHYFAWTYSDWESPVYEIGSRPPIGRYAPPPRPRPLTTGPRSGDKESKYNDRKSVAGPKPGKPRKGQGSRNSAPRPATPTDDRGEQAAISAITTAIETLQRDPNLKYVDLPASNSYQRRQQHQAASERGFQTLSIGEGRERAVRVTRGSNGSDQ
jgi:hypothetical protein